jgi:dolichyl-phosphate beta-glucosyltransferase
MITLSIVIPAYNETARIGPTLDLDAVERSHVIVLPENRGKGHAVRVGMLAAKGRRRMFLDADGSTPVSEIDHLLDALEAIGGHGIAFGSIAAGTGDGQPQVWVRSLSGRIGNWLTRQLVLPRVRDTQRGCKVMSDCVAEAVFPLCVIDGWGFDVELLALARALGYPLAEVPVEWSHVDGGHIRASSYLSTLRDLLTIRRRLRSDAYDIDTASMISTAHAHDALAHPPSHATLDEAPETC